MRNHVAERLGPGGVLIIDDAGFVEKGTTSVRVGRQYTGTSGKDRQLSDRGVRRLRHPLRPSSGGPGALSAQVLDLRPWPLSGGEEIPDERGLATKDELARDIVRRCLTADLPAAWVTCSFLGQPARVRLWRRAIPSTAW
ncbi:hypothetical protein GCM10010405_54070 [Streptomyces macrosporus]|uniref:Transposase IS701-like DDE domain-containing protein n=1 Tax=Streptomyces macrosporus TaxID=44032 RepID=A0ABN3KMW9_9ACTN